MNLVTQAGLYDSPFHSYIVTSPYTRDFSDFGKPNGDRFQCGLCIGCSRTARVGCRSRTPDSVHECVRFTIVFFMFVFQYVFLLNVLRLHCYLQVVLPLVTVVTTFTFGSHSRAVHGMSTSGLMQLIQPRWRIFSGHHRN
jgi:hypothetical protein